MSLEDYPTEKAYYASMERFFENVMNGNISCAKNDIKKYKHKASDFISFCNDCGISDETMFDIIRRFF
jgi:intergrase/recombinase